MANTSKIKNIIFDVGGVLIGYRWEDMLTKDYGLTMEKATDVAQCAFNSEYWPKFDAGLITLDEMVHNITKKRPDIAEEFTWFIRNCELMRVFRPEVYKRIQKLKEKGYNIYILSNYSQELFECHTNGADFWPCIDGCLVSYEVKCLKPEPKIYHELLNRFNLNPSECLFFDDRSENIEGGKKVGIDGVIVTGHDHLISELDKLL